MKLGTITQQRERSSGAGARREEAYVGALMLVAAALLTVTFLWLTGFFGRGEVPYRAYFKDAGGLHAGSEVRYAGGPTIGRVTRVRSDPRDSSRMEIEFRVQPDVPVKTDSVASITSFSPLGDNFLGIASGSRTAPTAPADSVLNSEPYVGFAELESQLNDLGPQAKELLANLNQRVKELQVTVARVNDLLNNRNRANLASTLDNLRGTLQENRPVLRDTLKNVDTVSAKLGPVVDEFKKTVAQAQDALNHIDATLVENRPDLRASIEELRKALTNADAMTDQLNGTLNANSGNLDDIIANFRDASENLRDFTEGIKERPYTLLRSSEPKARKPGQADKP
ncbi:MAG TPA: MlaD family protein [Candidatus Acidoferrales bacterium]|nr:MlaD family protein [Candidatus Acidoferrales bacterium]